MDRESEICIKTCSGSFHVLRVHIRTEFPVSAPHEHVPEKCLTTACP